MPATRHDRAGDKARRGRDALEEKGSDQIATGDEMERMERGETKMESGKMARYNRKNGTRQETRCVKTARARSWSFAERRQFLVSSGRVLDVPSRALLKHCGFRPIQLEASTALALFYHPTRPESGGASEEKRRGASGKKRNPSSR